MRECNDKAAGVVAKGLNNVNRDNTTYSFYTCFKQALRDELNALAYIY